MSTRDSQLLSGEWTFWTDEDTAFTIDTLPDQGGRSILVPAPWQSQAEDLRSYTGVAWYQRQFGVPQEWFNQQRIILRFGAVDYISQVWVNGQFAGEHEGGYLPFELDITELARPGENMLTVRVLDCLEDFPEVPHGKQSWYGMISGIWQDVWVDCRPEIFIQRARITPVGEEVRVDVTLNQAKPEDLSFAYEIHGPDGQVAAADSSAESSFTVPVPDPRLWDPDTPNLYTLVLTARRGNLQDTVQETFGFRTVERRDGQILLNGEPVYLRGALDQDYYPELIYTPPSQEYIENQLQLAKELGLNCLRVHIKIADPRYYEAADRMGILIWTELPNWKDMTEAARRRARATLEGMIERDWNHPSIIIWTIINENWGTDLTHNASHRAWLCETYDYLKALDPYRLLVDNSACYGNFHVVTDLEDYHNYYAMPDHYRYWRKWVANLASRPGWTFSPEIEDEHHWRAIKKNHWDPETRPYAQEVNRKGDEPLLVSEFGNWGLPDLEKLRACYGGQDPWWFETGYNWGDAVVYPHGVERRFHDYYLDRIFEDFESLTRASQEIQFQALKYEIEQIRRHPSLVGYVITEFTDLHWESNGLLDMCRNPKVYHDRFHTINGPDIIIPQWERLAFWPGETCQVILLAAHHSRKDLNGSRLAWRLDGHPDISGEIGPFDVAPLGVSGIGTVTFTIPPVTQAERARLVFEMFDAAGELAATNTLDIALLAPQPSPHRGIKIYAPELATGLSARGFTVTKRMKDADLAIVPHVTQKVYRYLQAGGKVLWLAESAPQGLPLTSWKVVRRHGTHWQGDWASSFSWIADHPFKSLPGSGGFVDFLFADITPEHIISGVTANEFATGVYSGIFVGWLQRNAALIAEQKIGEGRMMVSTYRLTKRLFTNPMAYAIFQDMVDHLAAQPD